jgi:hypothetical protein
MTIHVRQHLPGFVEIDRQPSVEVSSLEDVLAIPWIASWAQSHPAHDAPREVFRLHQGVWTRMTETVPVKAQTFHRWSQSSDSHRVCLMAEYDHGNESYVVAYLTSDEPIPLPEWQETEQARERRERWNRGDVTA